MATYVTSDLHGLSLSSWLKLLSKAQFSPADDLYVLGDVIDRRTDGGIEVLRWMMAQENVFFLLGNHEAILLACEFAFREICEEQLNDLTGEGLETLMTYSREGGDVTLQTLRRLLHEDPELVRDVFDYLKDAPLYAEISVGGKDFVLTHAGLGGFSPARPLEDYTLDELLWERPTGDETYYPDRTLVFGHTPTIFLGGERGKVLFAPSFTAIDTGAASDLPAALVRLDDNAVFYEEDHE